MAASSARRATPGRARMVVQAHEARVVLSRSASGPQHGAEDGHHERPDARVGSATTSDLGGNTRRGDQRQPRDSVERALQRAPDVPAGARAAVSPAVSGHQDPGASRMPAGSERPGRRLRLDEQDHSNGRGRRRARNGPSAPSCIWSIG